MIRTLLALAALLLASSASAQDSLDGHGMVAIASDGDADDLLLTWRPERQVPGSLGLEALFEYASAPLVLSTLRDDTVADQSALVDDLLTLNLAGSYALHERLSLGAALPLYLASRDLSGPQGPATGDVRLSAATSILLPDPDGAGLGLSVLPFLDLPTGTPARNLGTGRLGGGVLVPVGLASERLALSANLGLLLRPRLDVLNLVGGPHLIAGLGASYDLTEAVAVRAEVHLEPSLAAGEDGWSESPGEGVLSMRYRHPAGPLLTLGGATALTPGAGAALYRIFLGVGYGRKGGDDPDRDGLLGAADACPRRAEVHNGWIDEDGCPDALAELVVEVRDSEGVPIPDLLLLDGAAILGRTSSRGELHLEGLQPGRVISLMADDFHLEALDPISLLLTEGRNREDLELTWLPGRVTVITRSSAGPITNAHARFSGPTRVEGGPVTDGRQRFFLSPGDWRIAVFAPIFESQTREISIAADETAEVLIEVVLEPDAFAGTWLRAVVRDTDGVPIPEVSLTSRGKLLGLTDVNGEVRAGDLEAGDHLRIGAEHFFLQPLDPVPVDLVEGRNDLTLDMEWLPGRVNIITRSTQGPITTASARFKGPKRAPGGPITDGEELFYLGPGSWEIFVRAPVFDRERRTLEIEPDQTSVVVVEVTLRPETVHEDDSALVTLEGIRFDFDRATIRPESLPILAQVAVVLESRPDIERVEVQGHTDSGGTPEYNLDLSQRRVEAVVDYLVGRGVARGRLVARGYGETQPIAPNTTEEGREQNRRVAFVILEPAAD